MHSKVRETSRSTLCRKIFQLNVCDGEAGGFLEGAKTVAIEVPDRSLTYAPGIDRQYLRVDAPRDHLGGRFPDSRFRYIRYSGVTPEMPVIPRSIGALFI